MRRSMAQLAASLQSDASDNSPLELPPPMATSLEENANVNINPSLDYANALAKAIVPLSVSSEAGDQPREQEVESEMPQQGRLLVTAEQEYRAKAFELMTTNVKANLDYANKLRKLRTPLEFIELSTLYARKRRRQRPLNSWELCRLHETDALRPSGHDGRRTCKSGCSWL